MALCTLLQVWNRAKQCWVEIPLTEADIHAKEQEQRTEKVNERLWRFDVFGYLAIAAALDAVCLLLNVLVDDMTMCAPVGGYC